MTVNQASTVVGVFSDKALAEEAMAALGNAGFDTDQIRYASASSSGTGRFFDDIKGLFTGSGTGGDMVVRDLTSMGLSDEEARYYSNEYQKGYVIVAVKAPERAQEAMVILHRFGAYNYNSQPGAPEPPSPEPIDQEPVASTTDIQSRSDRSDQTPPAPIDQSATSPASTDQEQLASDEVEHDTDLHQPVAQHPMSQPFTSDEVEHDADPHQPAAQHPMSQPFTQPEDSVPEPSLQSEEDSVQENQHAQTAPIDYDAQLQDVRKQLEETQKQLEEARAQLQSAKERHAQIQANRQREAELRDARQQLQNSQAELQSTLQELRELQSQIGQPV